MVHSCTVMVYLMEVDEHVKCFTSSGRLRACPSGPVIPNPRILFCSCKQKKVIEVSIDFSAQKNIYLYVCYVFSLQLSTLIPNDHHCNSDTLHISLVLYSSFILKGDLLLLIFFTLIKQ